MPITHKKAKTFNFQPNIPNCKDKNKDLVALNNYTLNLINPS